MFGCPESLLLCGLFSSSGVPRSSSRPGLLIAVVSRVAAHMLWGTQASAVAARGLRCLGACGIFPDQGSNPPASAGVLTTHPPGKSISWVLFLKKKPLLLGLLSNKQWQISSRNPTQIREGSVSH